MKIGIVTAYDEHEANSEYSKALKEEFERQGHSVEILRLPFSIFPVPSYSMQKLAEHLIDEMVEKIKHLDYVNIQFEIGLFGTNCKDVMRRMNKIFSVCKENSFSLTLHSQVHFDTKKIKKSPLKTFFTKLKKRSLPFTQGNIQRLLYQVLSNVVAKKGLIITHTIRARNGVLSAFPTANIQAFPLCYKQLADIKKQKAAFDITQYKKEKGLILDKNTKIIGVLGAFTPWKDLLTCVKALLLLPENFHLFFFGGQHYMDIKYSPQGLERISALQEQIFTLGLPKRVHFMGFQATSDDMFKAHLFCDYIILPYTEVGEEGSGSASNALETCENVFMTRNYTFDELKKFTGESFFSFDMGNWMELAEKIKSLPDKQTILKNRELYFEKYNMENMVKMYLSVLTDERIKK